MKEGVFVKNNYFDKDWYKKICDTYQKNVFESEKMFDEYLKRFPQDYSAKIKYIDNLITIGKFDKATSYLQSVEDSYSIDTKYKNAKGPSLYIFENGLLLTKLKLFIYTNRYEEAYNLLKTHPKEFRKILGDYLTIELYLQKKLGLAFSENVPNYYNYQQIICYDKGKFYETVKDFYTKNSEKRKNIYFYDNFPLDMIVNELNILIPNENCIYNGLIDNHYYFKYNSCGINNGENCNYFTVVSYDNSTEFITMYPSNDKNRYPNIDLNYLNISNIPTYKRVRKMSQMDKFKQKYNYRDI